MLILTKGDSADWGATVLHDHVAHKDQKEKRVFEEAALDVELLKTELASVDLVEDLHGLRLAKG